MVTQRTSGDVATIYRLIRDASAAPFLNLPQDQTSVLPSRLPMNFSERKSSEFTAENETMRFGFAFKLSLFMYV